MKTTKLYDLSHLIGMIGDGESLQMMIKIFLESTPKILEEMNESLEKKDLENLARNAHKIKASLDIMKIDSLYDSIRLIDKYEKTIVNINRLEAIISQINTTLSEVFIQLKEEQSLQNQV